MPPSPTLLARTMYRVAQLTRVAQTLELDVKPSRPWLDAFAAFIPEAMGVDFPFDASRLAFNVKTTDVEAVEEVLKGWDGPADGLRAMAVELGAGGWIVSTEIGPAVVAGFGFRAPFPWASVAQFLPRVGVSPQAHAELLEIARALQVKLAREVRVETRAGEPRVSVTFDFHHAAAERERHVEFLDGVWARLGVSERQRRWAGATVEALAPRPMNETTLRFEVGASLRHAVTLTYPNIPTIHVLKLMSQFSPNAANGRRLGNIEGALGVPDVVTRLDATCWDGEPPFFSIGYEAAPVEPMAVPRTGN